MEPSIEFWANQDIRTEAAGSNGLNINISDQSCSRTEHPVNRQCRLPTEQISFSPKNKKNKVQFYRAVWYNNEEKCRWYLRRAAFDGYRYQDGILSSGMILPNGIESHAISCRHLYFER